MQNPLMTKKESTEAKQSPPPAAAGIVQPAVAKRQSPPGRSLLASVGIGGAVVGLLVGLLLASWWNPFGANTEASALSNAAGNSSAANPVAKTNASQPSVGSPTTTKGTIGISRDRVQAALDSPTAPRFVYRDTSISDDAPRVTGTLGGDMALVELIGPAESLSHARLVLQLTTQESEPVVKDAPYMLLFAKEVAPGWNDAAAWIHEFLPQAMHGATASTTQGNVRISLSRIEKFGLVMMTAEPN